VDQKFALLFSHVVNILKGSVKNSRNSFVGTKILDAQLKVLEFFCGLVKIGYIISNVQNVRYPILP